MAIDKFTVASSALILVGAEPISSFTASEGEEEQAAFYLYQSTLDAMLECYPWRFATKTTLLNRISDAPDTIWDAAYQEPTGMKALQSVVRNDAGNDIPYDRHDGEILCDATETDEVYGVHTYEPAVVNWPGGFVKLMEFSLAMQFAVALSAKLDMMDAFQKNFDFWFRMAKSNDGKQQTTRKLRTMGRSSIIEARRS